MITLPYNTLKLLGWTTVLLVLLTATFYFLLVINKKVQRSNSNQKLMVLLKKILKKLIPFIHSYHSALGTAALITGITHGYSLLQSVELHSGYVLWTSILFLGLTGISMKLIKNRVYYSKIRFIHRIIMITTISLVIYHILSMKYILF